MSSEPLFYPSHLVTVTVPGAPVGKGRPRGTADDEGGVRMYTPKPTRQWESLAAGLARVAWRSRPTITGAVSVTVLAIKQRTQADERSRTMPDGRLWRTTKPDVDNVEKAALDALVMARVIGDDTLVVALHGYSLYTARGEQACVEIHIATVPQFPIFHLAPCRRAR